MPKSAVIDGSLLIDIEDDDRIAIEVFERLQADYYTVCISPTGVQELIDIATCANGEGDGLSLDLAVKGIRAWKSLGVHLCELDGLEHGICFENAHKFIRANACTEEQMNIALIIAEASVKSANLVILDDEQLLTIDRSKIREVLLAGDLAPVRILGRHEYFRFTARVEAGGGI